MKYDLHIHSKYSKDSISSPEKIIKIAKKNGLNGVAVTDHNTIRGGLETFKANCDDEFQVVVGTEIKTEYGDIIGLFLNEEIRSRNFEEVIDEIRSQGGLSVLAHPYRQYISPENLVNRVELIEAFNARSSKILNARSYKLARSFSKKVTAGSDAHCTFDVGRGLTIANCEIETALKNGMTEIKGMESNYYLSNGLSITIETMKKLRDNVIRG
jgi:predicted metal-dependent phosphoesterase TrpH